MTQFSFGLTSKLKEEEEALAQLKKEWRELKL